MTIDPGMLFLIFFLLHFGVGLVAYVEKRLKPLLELLRIKSNETVSMLNWLAIMTNWAFLFPISC